MDHETIIRLQAAIAEQKNIADMIGHRALNLAAELAVKNAEITELNARIKALAEAAIRPDSGKPE